MTLRVSQLSDKLQRLDWGTSEFVNCGECYISDRPNVQCCLCNKNLKAWDFEDTHALMGGPKPNVEE